MNSCVALISNLPFEGKKEGTTKCLRPLEATTPLLIPLRQTFRLLPIIRSIIAKERFLNPKPPTKNQQ